MKKSKIKVTGTYALPYIARAEWTAYAIFSVLFIPIIVLWVFLDFKHPHSNAWQGALAVFAVYSAILAWLESFRIKLTVDKLFYHSLFSRGNQVLFSDITKIEFKMLSRGEAARRSAMAVLEIHGKGLPSPIAINVKPFSRRNLCILIDAATTKNPQIGLDEVTRKLKEGEFEPVTAAVMGNLWRYVLQVFWMVLLITLVCRVLLKH